MNAMYPKQRLGSHSKIFVCLLCVAFGSLAVAAEVARAQESADELYRAGKYDEALHLAKIEVDRGVWNEKWPKLLIRCQLARGRYADALQTYAKAVSRYSQSISMRMLGREVLLMNDRTDQAEREADEIFKILQQSSSRYASADSLVAAGRYFALRGEDARQILTLFYDRVRQADPEHLDAHLATAELAIEKGDFQVAAQTLAVAEKIDEQDPRVGHLQALAWATSDSQRATAAIQKSLACNPNYTPSLLLIADNAIDAERYDDAEATLNKVLEVNLHDWSAWSYLAVIAHLRGQYELESLMRAAALSTWSKNPGVDHLIGRKLSDNYRFEVGAAYQRRALAFDSGYTAASYQLANDLLRLGDDEIGWEVARQVSEADPYNVVVHNLMTLSDRLKKFALLEAEGIAVRMDAAEAEIYGDRVLDLLTEAKRVLCEKYAVTPRAPIVVEIYPQQKDFAIRTFGLPGGAGFLGVCFGRVITANSPASQGSRPSNWESVLWHEFCHAVTLEKTKNRMPRWLSEGISVYEERIQDGSWGQSMTPVYREMLLDETLTPVSQLSGSFLKPKSPLHLQFAYYQSSLVVEFLVDKYGIDRLKALLDELGNGLSINDAIGQTMRPIEAIDQAFAKYARERALAFGKSADWTRSEEPAAQAAGDDAPKKNSEPVAKSDPPPSEAAAENPWLLIEQASERIEAKQWREAQQPLEKLIELGIVYGERDGPLEQLAIVYRELQEPEKERSTLELINAHSSDSLDSLSRLIELARADGDWEAVLGYANKWIAIQPLLPTGHAAIAEAADKLGQHADAAAALLALSKLKPVDPAGIDLKLARAQWQLGEQELAKRSVLRALEIAPRYREAHRLLLQINEAGTSP
ncbi:MAG: tetratricopeptide repeat protein [Planctomycetaceae bacterium]